MGDTMEQGASEGWAQGLAKKKGEAWMGNTKGAVSCGAIRRVTPLWPHAEEEHDYTPTGRVEGCQ
jgi:hypothetical protein